MFLSPYIYYSPTTSRHGAYIIRTIRASPEIGDLPFFYLVKSPGDALPQVMEIPPQYISAIDASEKYKTTNDHITSLYRRGKVHGLIVGRSCYVDENSLKFYFAEIKKKKDEARKNLSEKLKGEYAQQTTEKQKIVVPSSTQKSYAYQFALSTVVLVVLFASVLAIQQPHFEHYSQQAGVLQSIGSLMSRFAGLFTPQSTLTQTSTTPVIIPNTSNEFITTNSSVNRPIVHNTYPITQRIIERVITTTTPATSGVSEAELKTKLDEVYRTFALVMSGFGEPNHTTVTTITNTVSGSYLPLSGGTLTGTLALTGATTTAVNGIDIASGCFSINGVCLTAGTGSSATGYPFPLAGNATSTFTQFNGGLTAYASSTIGNGFAGLTVNGNATTTGNAYFARNVGIGTTTPQAVLDVTGQALFNIPSTLPATLQNTWIAGVIGNGNIAQNGGFTQVNFAPTESGNYAGSQLQYGYLDTNNNYHELWSIGGEINDTSDQTTRDFYISQAQNGSQLTIFANKDVAIGGDTQGLGGEGSTLIAKGNGTVGIGTSSPFALASIHALNGSTNTTLFAIASSTQTATMTLFSVSNTGAASTTQLFGAGLASCSGSNALTWSSGLFGCTNLGSAAFAFTPTTNYGAAANATTTAIWFQQGLQASSTIFAQDIDIAGVSSYKQAGQSILIASSTLSNISVGFSAGAATTTTGTNNVAIGQSALSLLTTGGFNTAVGVQAGQGTTIGISNSYFGYVAGFSHTGNANVGLGAFTLNGAGNGSNNLVAGYTAGFVLSTGGNNTFLGARVASTTATGSNNIAIGYDIALPSANGSNQLNIGNLIFGTGINGEGTNLSTGSIGIGTTTPWAQFSINPDGITGPAFAIGSSTRTLFSVSNAGNVGIGVANAPGKLTVIGTNAVNTPSGEILTGRFWDGANSYRAGAIFNYSDLATYDQMVFAVAGLGGSNSAPNVITQAKMVINANGKIGMGTTSPFANLSVQAPFGGTSATLFAVGSSSLSATTTLFSVANTGTAYFSNLVGIGTTSPFAKLSVSANFGDTANVLFAIGSTTSSASTTNLFSVTNTGNVGLNNNAALTFGTLYGTGSTGYGIRENGGMIEFRNAYASTTALASNWTPISSAASVRYQLNETGWVNTGATLPTNLSDSRQVVIGDYVYLFGGYDNNTATSTIYRAPVSNPTAWVNTGATLPTGLSGSTLGVIGDYVYLFGGYDTAGFQKNTIYRAPLSNPTAWVNTGATLPSVYASGQFTVIGDYAYLFGGADTGGDTNIIWRASVANPTVWVNTGATLPSINNGGKITVVGDYIYLFGGYTAGGISNVIYRAPVSNPTAWVNTGAMLPGPIAFFSLAVIGDYVYLFGGDDGTAATNVIYRAPVSNPTAWINTGARLPGNYMSTYATIIGDYVYIFGGDNGTGAANNATNIIYRAPITSNMAAFDASANMRMNTPTGPWFQATSTNNNLSYLSGNVGVGSTSPFALLSLFANNSTTTGSIVAPATLFAIGSTTGAATSTLFSVSNTGAASTTQLFGAGLASCSGSSALTWSSGLFGCTNVGAAAFPFTPTTAFGSAANATSTLTGFLSGIYATASSTIGNGLQNGGLTINGGATTTGNVYIAGSTLAIGTSSPFVSGIVSQSGSFYAPGAGTTGYLFSNSTNTGLINASVSDLRLRTGGTDQIRMAGNSVSAINLLVGSTNLTRGASTIFATMFGNNGLGSTSAMAKLSVHAAGTDTNQYLFAIGSSTQTATTTLFTVDNQGNGYYAGNVGIGTSSPETTLTVVGAICAARGFGVQTTACGTQAGTIYANNSSLSGGYDLAETYPITDQSIEGGDVVAFDTSTSTTIMKASGTSPTFLGVVSTQPALLLGTLSSSTRPVALSGRVPVKVSLEHGAIAMGDRLTISTTTPGVAVKAITTGQTIGVALEPITTVTGTTTPTIVAFINPQFTLSPNDNEALAALLSPATSTPASTGGVLSGFFSHITAWLGDVANGIGDIFAKSFHAKDSICIDDQCLNKDDIRALLQMTRTQTTGTSAAPTSTTDTGTPAPSTPPDTQTPAADSAPADSSTAAPANSASSEQN